MRILSILFLFMIIVTPLSFAQDESSFAKKCCNTEKGTWYDNATPMPVDKCLSLPYGAPEDTPPAVACTKGRDGIPPTPTTTTSN